MNHLDVGYTNSISSVLNTYWYKYFPAAIATAAAANTPDAPPVFKYTTHAWLIDLYFDCPRRLGTNCPGGDVTEPSPREDTGGPPDDHPGCALCPNATQLAAVAAAIASDVIT